MKFKDLKFKTITVNHVEKFVNVYLHTDPNFVPEDGLLTLAKNLLHVKDDVYDSDIVEIFDNKGKVIAILQIEWNNQSLQWNLIKNGDYRLYEDCIDNLYYAEFKTINNSYIPVGYEIRNYDSKIRTKRERRSVQKIYV